MHINSNLFDLVWQANNGVAAQVNYFRRFVARRFAKGAKRKSERVTRRMPRLPPPALPPSLRWLRWPRWRSRRWTSGARAEVSVSTTKKHPRSLARSLAPNGITNNHRGGREATATRGVRGTGRERKSANLVGSLLEEHKESP